MKRILYIVPYLSIGGTEKHVLDLINGLADEHQIFLLAPPGETLDQFTVQPITYYSFPRLDQNPLQGIRQFFKNLKKILNNHSIDLIHIHGAPELILLVKMINRSIPVLFTLHGFHGPRKDWDYWGCTRVCNRFASQVIAVAGAEEEILVQKGLQPDRIRTIHNGVPDPKDLTLEKPALFTSLDHKQIIGVIARLETTKGIHILLESFAKLTQKYSDLHLIIVGTGSKEKDLKDQTLRLGLSQQVTFAGYRKNIHDYLHHYQIFVIPSLHEAHPLVLMEGMSHGKPIIATRVGGIPEVIKNGENGLLIDPEDVTDLATALETLLTNSELQQKIGQAARKTYEQQFTVQRMVRETEKVYDQLLKKDPV